MQSFWFSFLYRIIRILSIQCPQFQIRSFKGYHFLFNSFSNHFEMTHNARLVIELSKFVQIFALLVPNLLQNLHCQCFCEDTMFVAFLVPIWISKMKNKINFKWVFLETILAYGRCSCNHICKSIRKFDNGWVEIEGYLGARHLKRPYIALYGNLCNKDQRILFQVSSFWPILEFVFTLSLYTRIRNIPFCLPENFAIRWVCQSSLEVIFSSLTPFFYWVMILIIEPYIFR